VELSQLTFQNSAFNSTLCIYVLPMTLRIHNCCPLRIVFLIICTVDVFCEARTDAFCIIRFCCLLTTVNSVISGCRRSVNEICPLLECYVAKIGSLLPTFRDNLLDYWTLEDETDKLSGNFGNYQSTLRKIREEHRCQSTCLTCTFFIAHCFTYVQPVFTRRKASSA
jgi:hypothetical protein